VKSFMFEFVCVVDRENDESAAKTSNESYLCFQRFNQYMHINY
jgi:hypothetical protein